MEEDHDTNVDELNLNNLTMAEIVKTICDKYGLFHTNEDSDGFYGLNTLVKTLGYSNIVDFFDQNPKACAVVVNFICQSDNNDWRLELLEELISIGEQP